MSSCSVHAPSLHFAYAGGEGRRGRGTRSAAERSVARPTVVVVVLVVRVRSRQFVADVVKEPVQQHIQVLVEVAARRLRLDHDHEQRTHHDETRRRVARVQGGLNPVARGPHVAARQRARCTCADQLPDYGADRFERQAERRVVRRVLVSTASRRGLATATSRSGREHR